MNDRIYKTTEKESALIEAQAQPIVSYLRLMDPQTAINVLTAVVALTVLSLRLKDGVTPLTLLDNIVGGIRKTVQAEMDAEARTVARPDAAFGKPAPHATANPVGYERQGIDAERPDSQAVITEKPHYGRITDWTKYSCTNGNGLGYYIMGTLEDHPRIPRKHTNTSTVLKHDEATGEIETRHSRYTLVGPELVF